MNNRPITSRVKSGMFKTKEPLLNVGPAGVDGNNKTRTMPSPSKMKGYAMKSSPFKQTNQPRVTTNPDGTVRVTLETKETSPGNAGSNGSTSYKSRTIENAKGGDQATDLKKYMEGLYKRMGNDVTTDELIKRKFIGEGGREAYDGITGGKNKGVATVTPATDGTSDVIKTYQQSGDPMRQVIGEASTAYESRSNIRKGTQANRKVKSSEIKNARSKAKGGGYYKTSTPDDGGDPKREFVSAKDNKGAKETRKEARKENRRKRKEDRKFRDKHYSGEDKILRAKRDREKRKSNKKTAIDKAKTIKQGFKDDKSDIKARQTERNRLVRQEEADSAFEQANQRKTGFSQDKKIRTKDVGKTLADNFSDKQAAQTGKRKLVKTETKDVAASGKMKSSGFFKKKSPMKMNYFKK